MPGDAEVGQRRSDGGECCRTEHAPILAAVEDAVADPAGAEPSAHSADSVHEAGCDAGSRLTDMVYAAEECRQEHADRVHIEIKQRAGSDNPPYGGDAENCAYGCGLAEFAMSDGRAANRFLQAQQQGEQNERRRRGDHHGDTPAKGLCNRSAQEIAGRTADGDAEHEQSQGTRTLGG